MRKICLEAGGKRKKKTGSMENVKRDKTPGRLSIDPVFDSPVFDKNWYLI